MNDKGDYFPVWGTCLGFELLNLAVAEKMWMKRCSADDAALKIDFTKGKCFSSLSLSACLSVFVLCNLHFQYLCPIKSMSNG